MKKIRVITLVMLACLMMALLTSCVSETTTVQFKKDGGKIVEENVVTRETYDSLLSMGVTEEELKENGGVLKFFTEDGVEKVRFTYEYTYDSLEELNAALGNIGASDPDSQTDISEKYFNSASLSLNEEDGTMTFSGKVGGRRDTSSYSDCKMILKFPGKVLSTDIGTQVDDNTVEIDMLSEWSARPGAAFTVTAESKAPFPILGLIVLIVGVALVVTGVIVTVKLVRRRREREEAVLAAMAESLPSDETF